MEIASYVFQSPYPNSIQVGRPDPSAKKEDTTQDRSASLIKDTNQTLKKAEVVKADQTQEVQQSVKSERLLDTYA